jgi:hypothetical protein
MDKKILDAIMATFQQAYEDNIKTIESSGALSGDESAGMLAKVVLYLTARDFRPLSYDGKKLLSNLEHFI